ncbi:MAG: hypothetical protein H6627_09045 [Calditrichae bacterium]|nr:hypothetical protein [Calditrichia bacterium]
MKTSERKYTVFFWLGIIIILALNLLLWLYVNQVEDRFANELKVRLISSNRYIGRIIDNELLNRIIPGERNSLEYISIQQQIETIRRQDTLQSILLLSADGSILVSSPELLSIQKEVSRRTNSNFITALNGRFNASDPEQINESWYMSAYGPILDLDGFVAGVLIVEAKAAYFSTLDQLRNSLIIFSIINIIVISAIAVFLFRQINKSLQYSVTLRDQEHLVQLGTMAASVAHEIRNPLGIISGSNELIKKKYGKNNDEIFNFIPAEIARLSQLIENFLAFSRTPKIQKTEFLISTLFERIKIGLVTQTVIDFATAPKLSKDKIFADFNILEQAILNVLQNAIEVSPVNERITVKASKSRNLIIEISDHGPGIDKSILKDVFQPFFTTKEKGTGLGLAITKRLVELSGGNIDVKGNTPNGTVFILTIPQ